MMLWTNIVCYLFGHDFDKKKYETDLKEFYSLRKGKFKNKEEIMNYYNNPPQPFCISCQKSISFNPDIKL